MHHDDVVRLHGLSYEHRERYSILQDLSSELEDLGTPGWVLQQHGGNNICSYVFAGRKEEGEVQGGRSSVVWCGGRAVLRLLESRGKKAVRQQDQ